jgi:hypothetical protein
MADQVTVHAISVLWEFERAISQFQTTAREATLAVESALSATLDRVSRTELAAERHVSWTESSVEAAECEERGSPRLQRARLYLRGGG